MRSVLLLPALAFLLAACGGQQDALPSTAPAQSTHPASAPASAASGTDMKNTKCIVMKDDIGASTDFVLYQGKLYHTCCPDCIEVFNKDPEKYVKAFDADPASFGVKN